MYYLLLDILVVLFIYIMYILYCMFDIWKEVECFTRSYEKQLRKESEEHHQE